MYIDTGISALSIPSKSRDLADENNNITEWKWFETTLLQHVNIRNENQRSITTHYGQFWQLKVNYNTLWSVLTIKGQSQDIAISSDN